MLPEIIKNDDNTDQNVSASDDSLENGDGDKPFMTIKEFKDLKSSFISNLISQNLLGAI